MSTRMVVWLAGVTVLCTGAAWAADKSAAGPAATRDAASQPEGTPLKVLAGRRGVLFGVAAVGRLLGEPESAYARAVARECSIITPENDMKFGPLRPAADKWNWGPADSLVEFAERHGIKVHGHALVWHEQVPKWVVETKRTAGECRDLMLGHIEAVAGRYRGRVYAWDVVNEAIEKDGTLRKTYWKDNVGDDYIDLAFRKAHEVDPKAKLVYNDFGIEGAGRKADAAYNLVKGMKQRGVPIDAVGFQCHWEVGKYPPLEEIRANIWRLANLGLEVWITEMDLRVKVPSTPDDLARQAEAYAGLVKMFAETRVVRSIQTWGLDDGHSWVPHFFEGFGDALLLDKDLRPKPAYFAVMKVLESGLGPPLSAPFEEDIDNLVVGTPDDRIKASFEALYSAGPKAFPTLIQHFGDLRPTDLHLRALAHVGSPDGVAQHFTVGNICFEIIQAQVEGYGPKAFHYYVLTPENAQEWLSRHLGMTLKQLRVAAAEDSLTKAKADPALATQPSVRRSAVEFLRKHLEEVEE